MNIREYLVRTAYENEETRDVILPLLYLRTASEEALVSRVIKLAYENPELREYVLPFFTGDIFKEAGRSKSKKTKNRGNKGEKRKQNRAQKRNQRKNKNKKDKGKAPTQEAPTQEAESFGASSALPEIKGGLDSLMDWARQNKVRVMLDKAIEGAKQKDYSLSYALDAVKDEAHVIHEGVLRPLAKIISDYNKEWQSSDAKKKLEEGASEMAKQASEAIRSSLDGLETLDEFGAEYADQARDTLGSALDTWEATGSLMGRIKDWGESQNSKIQSAWAESLKSSMPDEDAEKAASGLVNAGKSILAGVSALSVSTATVGAMGAVGVGGALKGLFQSARGVAEGAVGVAASVTGKATKKVRGKKASEDELKDLVLDYFSYADADQIKYISKFMTEKGFDLKAFEADVQSQTDAFKKNVENELKKETEKAKKEKGEEAKKEVKVVKDELGEDAFVAKTAVVKLAYENPKYRPQLLQLLQVPRSHYALSDIKDCLSI